LQYQFTCFFRKAFIQYTRYKADIDAAIFTDDRDFKINNKTLASGAGLNYNKGIVSIAANYQYRELENIT
jgi:vitamin B12 transporter